MLFSYLAVGRSGCDRFVRDDEFESEDRSPLVSRSNPVAAAFAFSFANLRKRVFRRLHPQVTIEIRNITVRSLFDQVCAENFL